MNRSARMSSCGLYRFTLTRWETPSIDDKGTVLFVMNNPSVADGDVDDQTIRKCWRYVRGWGYCRMVVVNCNPYRATNPRMVQMPPDKVLTVNDAHIKSQAQNAELIICAWGGNADQKLRWRCRKVLIQSRRILHYLELTMDDQPKHPLYLKADIQPVRWA